MSDTPRTDHQDTITVQANVEGYIAMRDFARQLEREIAALKQQHDMDTVFLDSTREEIAALKADALRYQWLRQHPSEWGTLAVATFSHWKSPPMLDAAIDAAKEKP